MANHDASCKTSKNINSSKEAECLKLAWKTLGAETRLARADDNVADTIPAMVIGPNADTSCITWHHKQYVSGIQSYTM